jgi:hypothetical protein
MTGSSVVAVNADCSQLGVLGRLDDLGAILPGHGEVHHDREDRAEE